MLDAVSLNFSYTASFISPLLGLCVEFIFSVLLICKQSWLLIWPIEDDEKLRWDKIPYCFQGFWYKCWKTSTQKLLKLLSPHPAPFLSHLPGGFLNPWHITTNHKSSLLANSYFFEPVAQSSLVIFIKSFLHLWNSFSNANISLLKIMSVSPAVLENMCTHMCHHVIFFFFFLSSKSLQAAIRSTESREKSVHFHFWW